MNSSYQFLQYLQHKKKQINNSLKQVKIGLQQIQHKIQLPSVKTQHQRISITQNQFLYLIKSAKSKFLKQPSLLKIEAPIFVATGTQGSYSELSLIIQRCGHPGLVNYLFLGNYSGKYNGGIQCLIALLTYKIKHPFNFFMLRGAFQTIQISKGSILYKQIIQYFGSNKIWIQLCELFCCLPFAAIINEQIFCAHGGVNQYLFSLQQINQINRPFNTPQKDLPHDLIFSQPDYFINDHKSNIHVHKFGQEQIQNFMKRTSVKLICRSKQVVQKGFELIYNKSVVNLCSISNYKNIYSNTSAVMMVDDQMNVMFKQISDSMALKYKKMKENMNYDQIIQKTQQKKERLQKLEKKELQKNEELKAQKQKLRLKKQEIQKMIKEKYEKRKIEKLKQEIIEQMRQRQNKQIQTTIQNQQT